MGETSPVTASLAAPVAVAAPVAAAVAGLLWLLAVSVAAAFAGLISDVALAETVAVAVAAPVPVSAAAAAAAAAAGACRAISELVLAVGAAAAGLLGWSAGSWF